MLMTITTTHTPATDLGYLLGKHPARCQEFTLPFGTAHVFFPHATAERCTAALLVEIDPVTLVRRREGLSLASYVNDRPYVTSSLLSVAISRVLGSALGGRSADRPVLAATPIPLTVHLPATSCRGGEALLEKLLAPLGYTVQARRLPLDPAFPQWGDSAVFDLTLTITARLSEVLSHLYVLLPVLDNRKHYWIDDAEQDKLLAHGEGWLADHPQRDLITGRYLKRQGRLVRKALAALSPEEATAPEPLPEAPRPARLRDLRDAAVLDILTSHGVRSVADVGCGEGKLLKLLAKRGHFSQLIGADVSLSALAIAERRLPERVRLIQSSLVYRDQRLEGLDAITLVEVIEHIDEERLPALRQALFGRAKPRLVVITTPNAEHNRCYDMPPGALRHPDHRFEWTRAAFAAWASTVTERYPYAAIFSGVGAPDPVHGPPTQVVTFIRETT